MAPELSGDTPPDAAAAEAFAGVIWPVIGEMAIPGAEDGDAPPPAEPLS